jgi:hypothetical protein
MSKIPKPTDDLRQEYEFDYSQARPNRFAARRATTERPTVTISLENGVASIWEIAKDGPVAVTSAGKTIAYVLAPEDFERSQREQRKLGFAKDLVGDIDLETFNEPSPKDMGFEDGGA